MVSAIIPARNEEASIARAVESVAAQPEVGEVIVVDDESTDRTPAILAELVARVPKLRVLNAGPLPLGWTGKNHALALGAAAAQGDWLLFTDADTFHFPGSTARALSDATDRSAVLVSYSPEQQMETFWERALIPVVYSELARKYSYERINNPDLRNAAANGQFLLIRRSVYASVGGHAAVAPQILEDVALAAIVKNAGNAIYFAAPTGVVRTRMYRTFAAMWDGWTKNLYLLFPRQGTPDEKWSKGMVAVAAGLLFAIVLGIPNGGAYILAHTQGRTAASWAMFTLLLVVWHIRYAFVLQRNHFPPKYIQYGFVGSWLFMLMHGISWWKNTHGTVVWKGRAYPAEAQPYEHEAENTPARSK